MLRVEAVPWRAAFLIWASCELPGAAVYKPELAAMVKKRRDASLRDMPAGAKAALRTCI
jgi:hypothetical protein